MRKRGGSWNNNPNECRCANRNNYNPRDNNNNVGFRVVSGPPALFCARTGRWESVGRAEEESRLVPVM